MKTLVKLLNELVTLMRLESSQWRLVVHLKQVVRQVQLKHQYMI
jgi:hypothetical protein